MNMRGILFLAGLSLTVIAICLIALGIDGLRTPIPCVYNACLTIFSSTYANYWDEIYAGIAMVVLGAALMLASRRLETEAKMAGDKSGDIRRVQPTITSVMRGDKVRPD